MLTQSQKDQILNFIQALKAKSFTFRDVVRILDLDSDDRRSLQHFLDELDADERIHRVKRGHYAIPSHESVVAGILSCHRDGYGFLIPDDRTKHREDIFIPARSMEDALHEDRVLVRVLRKKYPPRQTRRGSHGHPWKQAGRKTSRGSRGHPKNKRGEEKERVEGVVVRVLERKQRTVVGRYCAHPRFPFVVPLDTHFFHDIRIPFQAAMGAQNDQIVAVRITLPPGRNQIPQGKIIEILGYMGDPGIEYRIVEQKYGLPVTFSSDTLREADAFPDHVLEKEYEGREDFRDELIITIDGETARDFDDAVGLRRLSSGNFLLGVHIADVSHYVSEGSSIDAEAYARGTSVYFPDRAIPMLPGKLSSGICSLNPGVDRLVLSVIIEVDIRGNVIDKRFLKGVIRSYERMTYTSVAKILVDRNPEEMRRFADIILLLETMEELCLILSKKRYRRGAVDFDLPEAQMEFDSEGRVISVVPAERNIAHRIIEEFMLLANECVAAQLTAAGGPALYRVHEEPDPAKVEEFSEFALNLGYRLEKFEGHYRPKDFQKFVLQLEGKSEQKFLVYLMLRSFMQAHYSERNLGHFGLATIEYTHFTSPIRRYPDLVVHRLVKAHFGTGSSDMRRETMSRDLSDVAAHTSSRERIAEEAEREIEKIKKAQFMREKIGEEFDAIVLSPSRNGCFVQLLDHYVEGFVPVELLIDDDYIYREDTRSLAGRNRRRRYCLGSKVRVRLERVDSETARLTFSITKRL